MSGRTLARRSPRPCPVNPQKEKERDVPSPPPGRRMRACGRRGDHVHRRSARHRARPRRPPPRRRPRRPPRCRPMTRTYYIAADEVEWNYAPLGHNGITGEPFGDQENTFVANGPDRIGSTYRKALYREYTDASFSTLKPRAGGGRLPRLPRPGHPRAGRRHAEDRVPQQHARSRPACTRTTSSTTRRARAPRTPTAPGRRRRATTRSRPARPTPTRGRCPSGPAPAPATAPPCCRCTTRTRTRSATPTAA